MVVGERQLPSCTNVKIFSGDTTKLFAKISPMKKAVD
jgi:hypothetical protein